MIIKTKELAKVYYEVEYVLARKKDDTRGKRDLKK